MTSCCEKVEFKEGETFWISNYQEGDNIVFKSNQSDTDTIRIDQITSYRPEGKCNPLVSNYIHASVRIDYSVTKDTFKYNDDYLIQLRAAPGGAPSLPVLRLFNMEFHEEAGERVGLVPTTTTLKTLGLNLTDCFIFNSSNCEMNYNQRYGMTYFVWSKQYGLVKYGNDFQEWELMEKL